MEKTIPRLFKQNSTDVSIETAQNETLSAAQHIIVPQSAYDATHDQPRLLVQAVVNYVNYMMQIGRYTRHELCEDAVRAFHCEYYLKQVNAGGHTQFVGNTRALLDVGLADILFGLKDIGAHEHLILVRRMSQWMLENEDQINLQTGFDKAVARPLAELDGPFFALEHQNPLTPKLAMWLAQNPALRVVEDDDMPGILKEIAVANPKREQRDAIMSIVRMQGMVSQNPEAQFSVVAGALAPPEPVIAVGGGSYMELDGETHLTFTLRTIAGLRWCVLTEDGAALYERIIYDNSDMPLAPEDMSPQQQQNWKAPEFGEQLAFVPTKQIASYASIAKRLHAGAAVHLLLQELSDEHTVDYITMRDAGPDENGVLGITLLMVMNKATVAMSAIVTEDQAVLLSEPDHEELARVSSEQILEHAAEFSPQNLH